MSLAISEREFQTKVTQLAILLGFRVYHTHDSRGSQAGFPDLVMCDGRRVIFAELKSHDGRMRPEQEAWITDLRSSGAETHVWRAGDWDLVMACLNRSRT